MQIAHSGGWPRQTARCNPRFRQSVCDFIQALLKPVGMSSIEAIEAAEKARKKVISYLGKKGYVKEIILSITPQTREGVEVIRMQTTLSTSAAGLSF